MTSLYYFSTAFANPLPPRPDAACASVRTRARGNATVMFRKTKEDIMPTGSSPKREREYKELKEEFKKEHRYPGREEEVAARIVNKQRAEHGETEDAKKK